MVRGYGRPIGRTEISGYRVDVQGLRGISVLLVVLFHAGLNVNGGFIGVDVFFVISGFVIGRGLVSEAARTGTVNLAQFYGRRIRRLLPALAAMVTVVSIASVVILAPAFPQPNALLTARAATFSLSNIFLWAKGGGYFSPLEERNPFVHTWSLGIEEQFYLVFPLLVFLSWRLARRAHRTGRASFSTIVVAISVASFACSIAWTFGITPLADLVPQAERFAFYGPISRIWEFLAGVLVGLWSLSRATRRSTPSRLAGWVGAAGLIMVLLSAFLFSADTPFPGVAAVLPVAGAALVIASGAGPVRRLLEQPALVWIGDRSYSWYLWHWPAIVLLPVVFPSLPGIKPIAALVSLLPAVLSYRFLEQRFRVRHGEPARITAPRLAAVSVAVPLVVLTASLFGASRDWGLHQYPELSTESISQNADCFESFTTVEQCTFGDGDRGTIMLVGDSHADTISDAVVEAATAEGYNVVVQTGLGCPFVTVSLAFNEDCTSRQQQTFDRIGDIRPEVLVVANNSPLAISAFTGAPANADVYAPVSSDALGTWESALRTTFTDVEPFVDRVVLFSVVPGFRTEDFEGALLTLLRPSGAQHAESIETVQRSRAPILDAERRATEAVTILVTTVDPLTMVCPEDECAVRFADGRFRYRDPTHLSNAAAREFADPIRDALRAGSS